MNLLNSIKSIFTYRVFVWEMAKRDMIAINKGAVLGYLWQIISPLIQTTAYVVIVSFIFRQRFQQDGSILSYALYVLSGQIPWQIVTRSLQTAPMLVRERIDIIKQVIYPIETLPITVLITAGVGSSVSLILFIVLAAYSGVLHISVLLLPIPIVMLIIFILGCSWIFMIAGVILKDIRDVITVLLGLLVFLSPVILTEAMVGAVFWKIILCNPLAHIVIVFRDVFYGTMHPISWVIFASFSILVLLIGATFISKMRIAINEFI